MRSSFVIVPTPAWSPRSAFTGDARATSNDSSLSKTTSPATATAKVFDVSPGANVSVLDADV